MKKFLALLLAALMLTGVCAFAEESVPDSVVLEVPETEDQAMDVEWVVVMDEIPAGYKYEEKQIDDMVYCFFNPEKDGDAAYILNVSYNDNVTDVILTEELANENLDAIIETLGADFADPVATVVSTTHGTACIMLNEEGSESEYGLIYSKYNGWEGVVYLSKEGGDLTSADFDLGLKIMSDLQISVNGEVVTGAAE